MPVWPETLLFGRSVAVRENGRREFRVKREGDSGREGKTTDHNYRVSVIEMAGLQETNGKLEGYRRCGGMA